MVDERLRVILKEFVAGLPVSGKESTLIHYDQDEAALTTHTVRGVEVALLSYDDGPTYAWWYEQGLSLSLTYTGDSDAAVAFLKALIPYAEGGR